MKKSKIPPKISNFIETKHALERVQKVIDGMESGIPLLLDGETGTSKTSTAKKAAEINNQKVILFNFSSETTVEDLLGRISRSPDSWSGFSFTKGPYTRAFEEGYCIILDEINLAHEVVLQCIEASLDSKTLSLDFSGSEIDTTIQMHPDFHIIATKNPLTSRFSQKRHFLSTKFTSRFQIIGFGEIGTEELLEIATGLSENVEIITKDFLTKLIAFHFQWQEKAQLLPSSKNSASSWYVFTIREICRTINSIRNGLTPFEAILINYGSRYDNTEQDIMRQQLRDLGIQEEYKFFPKSHYIRYIKKAHHYENKIIKTKMQNQFYLSPTVKTVVSTAFHFLDEYSPILLVGPDGCGKTAMSRWIADLYTSYLRDQFRSTKVNDTLNSDSDADDDDYDDDGDHFVSTAPLSYKFFICNPEVTISDIIGRYMPHKKGIDAAQMANNDIRSSTENLNSKNSPIEWIYGPVVQALINGECLVLDQIDTAPSTILERLNSLLDTLGEKDSEFQTQENLEKPSVKVDPNFRIIATASLKGLIDMSPAFLNRFTIIYINEQLAINHNALASLIQCNALISSSLKNSRAIELDINFINLAISKKTKKLSSVSSSDISRCVKSFFRLKNKFPTAENTWILDFCFDACINHKSEIPDMNESFIDILLTNLKEDDFTDLSFDPFHYKEAASTRKIMATLVACSVIGLHTILIGRTGLGKTAAALAFSRMSRPTKQTQSHLIAFNGETQLDELYGYFTMNLGSFDIQQGELSKAMADGEVFIADELNLAQQQIIQSLNIAIEPDYNQSVILPITGSSVSIKEGFFFIGCQNDLTMNGRKPIPESIRKKLLCINYPENSPQDLYNLILSISKQFNFDRSLAKYITALMTALANDKHFSSRQWSLREVRKLFRRISFFKKKVNQMKNFSNIHHVAFMLYSTFHNNEDLIEHIARIVCEAFTKNQMKSDLINDMKATVEVELIRKGNNDAESEIKLTKGSLEIIVSNIQLLNIPNNLQTFWQTIFDVSLTDQAEPLLFVGPSGFKTYLSEMVSSLAPTIYLHSGSTIASLIGQIALLNRYQAKLFLLDSLNDFTAHNVTLKDLYEQIRDQITNEGENEIDRKLLNAYVQKIRNIVPQSFIPIIKNLKKQLLSLSQEDNDEYSNSMFSNFLSLFKPGLITQSIFRQNSLILKNFAQPSPTVIERFNELLSVTPTLTLFEDTTGTFVPAENNKLFGFSNVFRIIGICLPREKRNLSDAMLSRLTEISVRTYTSTEQMSVFNQILEKNFDGDLAKIIKPMKMLEESLEIFEELQLDIPFRQKVKIIHVASRWLKKFPEMDISVVFIISILRCAGGPLDVAERRHLYTKLKEKFPYGFDDNTKQMEVLYKENLTYETPYLESNDTNEIIASKLTGFQQPNIYITRNMLDAEQKLLFAASNIDLIDVIFSFSIINYPLIIEGPNGSGKSSAFFYVAELLGVKTIQITISPSTTVEDLFGRFEPSNENDSLQFDFQATPFLKAIDNENSETKHWILVENLHLASPSVIDALEPIFNPQIDNIALPNGSLIQRGNFFIVGLISKSIEKQSISNTALYYTVPSYTVEEYSEIAKFILTKHHYDSLIPVICPSLETLYELSLSGQLNIPFTSREVNKFIKMVNASQQCAAANDRIKETDIVKILCVRRFLTADNRKDICKLLNISKNEEQTTFAITNGGLNLASSKVQIGIDMKKQSRHNEIDHLTQCQQQLFEFLVLNVQTYMPIVVQGPTASGKTFSIQLFADAIGQNLKVIQMNSEINASYIAGSYLPSDSLSQKDMVKLQSLIDLLTDFSDLFDEYQDKIDSNDANWTASDFSFLQQRVNTLIYNTQNQSGEPQLRNENELNQAIEFSQKVKSALSFFNHLTRSDSLITKAMVEGSWVLLDGIESASPDFLDRLSTLLDDPPILNLYERGSNYIYSTQTTDDSKRIHPNFRLFMTYNPMNTSHTPVSSSLLSRCSLFSMDPIDESLLDSALVISTIIDKCVFDQSTPAQISAILAKIHLAAKGMFRKQLTCRTLIYLSREINYKNHRMEDDEKMDNDVVKSIIKSHYCLNNSGEDTKDLSIAPAFEQQVNAIFEEPIEPTLIEAIEKVQRNASKVLISLDALIQDYKSMLSKIVALDDKPQFELFKISFFLDNLLSLELGDIPQLSESFIQLKDYIKDNIESFHHEEISHFAAVMTICELINELNTAYTDYILPNQKYHQLRFKCLDSDILRQNKDISPIIQRIQQFINLYNKKLYLDSIPVVLIDNSLITQYFLIFKHNDTSPGPTPQRLIRSLNNNSYAPALFDIQDLANFDFSPYKWKRGVTPLQQLISSLFKKIECQYLFTGLLRVLYIVSHRIMKKTPFFNEWLQWLTIFFEAFKLQNYNVKDSFFLNYLEESKKETDQEIVTTQMQRIENLKRIYKSITIPDDKDNDKVKAKQFMEILMESITSLYNSLSQTYNDRFVALQRNKEAAQKYVALKNKIVKQMDEMKDNSELRQLHDKMNLITDVTPEDHEFIRNIYQSIIIEKRKKKTVPNYISWPTPQTIEKNDIQRSKLIDALIEYSVHLQKLEQIEESVDWTLLCSIPISDPLMEEFITNKVISPHSIAMYKSALNAQLLMNLFDAGDTNAMYEYCNRANLFKFFNRFNDRFRFENEFDGWARIAQTLSNAYPDNFLISIPKYTPFDIISLFVNPLTHEKGCIFDQVDPDEDLINAFYDLFNDHDLKDNISDLGHFQLVQSKIEKITMDYLQNALKTTIKESFLDFIIRVEEMDISEYIKMLCQQIEQAYMFSEAIEHDLNQPQSFDFHDITDIHFKITDTQISISNFETYLDSNPCSGFYLAAYPEVTKRIHNISSLCTDINSKNGKFPLALFEFRIFSSIKCVQFQLPSSFADDLPPEFNEFIYQQISGKLKNLQLRTIFSNFIGFLLNDPPAYINRTYSEYLRSIVINLFTASKNPLLKSELYKFLERFLPGILNILGTKEWTKRINQTLTTSSDEIIGFLANPWKLALAEVAKSIEQEKQMNEITVNQVIQSGLKKIFDLSSQTSINELKKNIQKDENQLQEKLVEEYKKISENSKELTQTEKDMMEHWNKYCKLTKTVMTNIKALPERQTNPNAFEYSTMAFYPEFHQHFSKELKALPCTTVDIIAVIPKAQLDPKRKVSLHYTVGTQRVEVRFHIADGVALFQLPKDTTIETLNPTSPECNIYIDKVKIDHEVIKYKSAVMNTIITEYNNFVRILDEIQQIDSGLSDAAQIIQKIGRVKVLFGGSNSEIFIKTLQEIANKYRNKSYDTFDPDGSVLTEIKNDISQLEKFTTVAFSIERVEKPHNTIDFLGDQLADICRIANTNFIPNKFALFSDEFKEKLKLLNTEEMRELAENSSRFNFRLTDKEVKIDKNDFGRINDDKADFLLTPSIYQDETKGSLTVNITMIQMDVGPFLFGIETSPLKLKLGKFTKQEIVCEFVQFDDSLPLPTYADDAAFLSIIIPLDKISNNALNYVDSQSSVKEEGYIKKPKQRIKKFQPTEDEIFKIFHFNGVISLKEKNSQTPFSQIKYDIKLQFVSIVSFITVQNHYFALKDGMARFVPFLATANTEIVTERITNKGLKENDKISEGDDNQAPKPGFTSSQIKDKKRIFQDLLSLTNPDKDANPAQQHKFGNLLSMNQLIAFSTDKTIKIPLRLTITNATRYPPKVLIFDDHSRDFSTSAFVNIGNLPRKVYFLFGFLNTTNEPIRLNNKSVLIKADPSIDAIFDSQNIDNQAEIPPNQYGYQIYSFEATYNGPGDFYTNNKLDAQFHLKIPQIHSNVIKIPFTFILNRISFGEKVSYSIDDNSRPQFKYYSNETKVFCPANIYNIVNHNDPVFSAQQEQILLSPFAFGFNIQSNTIPKLQFYRPNGEFTKIIFSYTQPTIFEVLLFNRKDGSTVIHEYDDYKKIYLKDSKVILFARLKNRPETFFPVYSYAKNTQRFNIFGSSFSDVYNSFKQFFISQLNNIDRQHSINGFYPNEVLGNSIPSHRNIAFIIYMIATTQCSYDQLAGTISTFIPVEFSSYYFQSKKQLKQLDIPDPYLNFLSFVSALQYTVERRIHDLQRSHFYIYQPIPIPILIEEKDKFLKSLKLTLEDALLSHSIQAIKKEVAKINNFEQEEIEKLKQNGYQISKILKYTEKDGLVAATDDELEQFLKREDIQVQKIINNELIKPADGANTTIDLKPLSIPSDPSIASLYTLFDEAIRIVYRLSFNIYSVKKSNQDTNISRICNLLTQIISLYKWTLESKNCFPFHSFLATFKPAFLAMYDRLQKTGFSFLGNNFINIQNTENEYIDYPTSPPRSIVFPTFQQPGLSTTRNITPNVEHPKPKPKPEPNPVDDQPKPNKRLVPINQMPTTKGLKKLPVATVKQIGKIKFQEVTGDTVEEVSNPDFIKYLINQLINKTVTDETLEYKADSDRVPESLKNPKKISINPEVMNSYLEASKQLSNVLINKIPKDEDCSSIYKLRDFTYSSILVDCSSTFTLAQKVNLVLLTIALGNALSSLRIPYSIILFCDTNFQYILKDVNDDHSFIHFQKLLDTIVIRRRMSDMAAAIQMAIKNGRPNDKKRINHSIYVLTDGLSRKIRLTERWKSEILNDNHLSIFFYFMDILPNSDQKTVHPIWDAFQNEIKSSKSHTSVLHSLPSDIYNGSDLFVNPFIESLSSFPKIPKKQLIHSNIITIDKCDGEDSTEELLDQISNILQNAAVVNDKQFYLQSAFSQQLAHKLKQVDINLMQPIQLDSFISHVSSLPSNDERFASTIVGITSQYAKSEMIQEVGTFVFPVNKATQFTPWNEGSIFYFPGLVKFILTQGQDNKIFLNRKAGYIRSYSVFIIIDVSISCLNEATMSHFYQTLLALLGPLTKLDIPSLNIILSTESGPFSFVTEKPTMEALSDVSFWVSLFSALHTIKRGTNSDLYSTLLNVYQMRIQQKTASSYCFILTDGCYSFHARKEFNSIFNFLSSTNLTPIAIGIGSYPYLITEFTPRAIYAPNPQKLWDAILCLFGKETSTPTNYQILSVYSILLKQYSQAQLSETLEKHTKEFEDLYNELNRKVRPAAIFQDYYNQNPKISGSVVIQKEVPQNEDSSKPDHVGSRRGLKKAAVSPGGAVGPANPQGNLYDLGKQNYYQGVKVLFIMCWDATCSATEDTRISENVLRYGVPPQQISVIKALEFFGITSKIVKNYTNAITELKSGLYSQAWIICGRMDGTMPGKPNPKRNDAKYIESFVDCLIQYWQLGGGLVFWTDNYPLCAEANLFLQKAQFKGFNNQKVNFHIGGNDIGQTTLTRENLNTTKKTKSVFDGTDTIATAGYEKPLFNYSLTRIFEGITVAYAVHGKESEAEKEASDISQLTLFSAKPNHILPFKVFSRARNGGISSMYYMSPIDCTEGDIIIDCGFSKLFFELTEEGIDRYVKNIAVWMLSLEKKEATSGDIDPRKVHPPAFSFSPKPNNQIVFNNFKQAQDIDFLFLIDGTGSMRYFIEAIASSCLDIAQEFNEKFGGITIRFGAVIYRDTAVTSRLQGKRMDKVDVCDLSENPQDIAQFFSTIKVYGGGSDGPEDWVSGYQAMLNQISWNEKAIKVVIHVADAPGHGSSFTTDSSFCHYTRVVTIPVFRQNSSKEINESIYNEIQNEQDNQFRGLIQNAARMGLSFFCLNGNYKAMYCFKQTQELFLKSGGKSFVIQNQVGFHYRPDDDQEAAPDINILVNHIKQFALSSVDIAVAVVNKKNDQPASGYEKQCQDAFTQDYNNFVSQRVNHIPRRDRSRNGRGGRGNRGGRGRGSYMQDSIGSGSNDYEESDSDSLFD